MRFFGKCGIFLGVLKHSRFGRWFLREPINGWDSFNLLEIMRWSRWRLISRLVLSVTASGKVLTAFYSCLRLNTLLTSEPQTNIQGRCGVGIYILFSEMKCCTFALPVTKFALFSSQSFNTDLRRRGRCRWSAGQRREAGGWRSRRGQRLPSFSY